MSFGQADWARVSVCFDLQLALLRKNCLLKDRDNVLPEPVITMRRAARLSHDVVMLSGEESYRLAQKSLGESFLTTVHYDLTTLDNAHKLSRCGEKTSLTTHF